MTHLDLCSGIGGFSLALKHLVGGFRTIGYVEIERYCREVLRARIRDRLLDDAPIFHDLREFAGERYRGRVDIITAGFPCQPFSVAGKQKGETDERNLWPDVSRVICEVQPHHVLLENVPGLLSNKYVGRVFGDLAEGGYDIKWDCIPASAVGANHQRDRLWIVADNRSQRIQRSGKKAVQRECRVSRGEDVRRTPDSRNRPDLSTPTLCRHINGIPNGVERLHATGNAVVPAVVAKAWETLT